MKILITGAAGFIGRRLVDRLQMEHEVTALARNATNSSSTREVRWIGQDLTQPLNMSSMPTRVDVVIHLAQSRFYKDFPGKAEDIFKVNVEAAFRLLEYSRKAGARRFIFASTGGVYGHGHEGFSETDPVRPSNFYLSSKYITELLLANYQTFFDTLIFRLFFVYGTGQSPSMLIPRLIRSVIMGTPITLQGPDGILINPIYISDVIDALCRSLELEGNHLINLAGPQVLSLREISNVIGDKIGRAPLFTLTRESEPYHLMGDITKMKELLGPPQVTFSEGIAVVCSEMEQAAAKTD